MKLLKIISIYLIVGYLLFYLNPVLAQNMSSDHYELQMGNFNMASGSKASNGYKLLDTVGQTAPGQYDSNGYIVKAGFIYIKTLIPFSFTISDLSIDFGSLIPGAFSTKTTILTVSTGSADGYRVTAFENHPLQIIGASTQIADTTCNGGVQTCDQITAKIWTDTSKYGFGFNMAGHDIASDFIDSAYFRQFSNDQIPEEPQTVMSSTFSGRNRQATVTFQINISDVQAAGDYENMITFICAPTY